MARMVSAMTAPREWGEDWLNEILLRHLKSRARRKKRMALWRKRDQGIRLYRRRQYYLRNRERIIALKRNRYRMNTEKAAAYRATNYRKNKAKLNELSINWAKNNPEKISIIAQRGYLKKVYGEFWEAKMISLQINKELKKIESDQLTT